MKESIGSFGKKAALGLGLLVGVSEVGDAQVASLRGSAVSQIKQNKEADKEHLTRIKNEKGLVKMENDGYLVKISQEVHLSQSLQGKPENCFVRPWTNTFLVRFTHQFENKFGTGTAPEVSSAVRTIEQQKDLKNKYHNNNAASTSGPKASSHPTGSTIDLKKKGLSKEELAWTRKVLLSLEQRGLIEATEEHGQECFHIMVFEKYGEYVTKKK